MHAKSDNGKAILNKRNIFWKHSMRVFYRECIEDKREKSDWFFFVVSLACGWLE